MGKYGLRLTADIPGLGSQIRPEFFLPGVGAIWDEGFGPFVQVPRLPPTARPLAGLSLSKIGRPVNLFIAVCLVSCCAAPSLKRI